MTEEPKRHVYIFAEVTSGKAAALDAMLEQMGVKPTRFIIGDEWSELPYDFPEKLDRIHDIGRERFERMILWKSWGSEDG